MNASVRFQTRRTRSRFQKNIPAEIFCNRFLLRIVLREDSIGGTGGGVDQVTVTRFGPPVRAEEVAVKTAYVSVRINVGIILVFAVTLFGPPRDRQNVAVKTADVTVAVYVHRTDIEGFDLTPIRISIGAGSQSPDAVLHFSAVSQTGYHRAGTGNRNGCPSGSVVPGIREFITGGIFRRGPGYSVAICAVRNKDAGLAGAAESQQ